MVLVLAKVKKTMVLIIAKIAARCLASILTPLLIVIGGFASNNYWSSSEYNNNNAWKQNFNNGNQNNNNKNNTNYVRAVRGFKQNAFYQFPLIKGARGI